ncbi:hypothetical protein [Thermophilibacter provencensis]|uniref:DUF5648 domain-containing protein n=1 Tax=Thermophilibacter provencensis TaxID=1852386 RepID=A0ABT7V5M0_9ACTN|nr:hypothetical protein [Thermophilibacter provencensis]MDM8271900.1 hypothetical protein [Thermophilibacter provencensis]
MALAEDAVDTWDGTADTSWYTEDPEADTFTLETAEDLAGLAELTNRENPVTFTGKTVLLDCDVDMSGHLWVAISQNGNNSSARSFSGTFDGQGHVIHNLSNVNSTEYRYGLFGTVHEATICNVGLKDVNVAEAEGSTRLEIGSLISWASSSTVKNCWADGKLTTPGGYLVGGLIGQCTGGSRVIGCSCSVDVSALGPDDPTTGGLVGQWENAAEDSLISSCYFDGSVTVAADGSACGGILGGNFDFDGAPGVTIESCAVFTTEFSSPGGENITYVAAVDEDATVKDCIWPEGDALAVASLIVDWSEGTASADPDFDQTQCGTAVTNFSDPTIVEELNKNASEGITWVMGIDGHPVFSTQTHLIAADYSAVDDALAAVPEDLSGYTAESAAALEEAIGSVDRTLTADRQAEVNAMVDSIVSATSNLEPLASYDAVDAAVAKARAIDRALYTEDTLAKLDAAVRAVVPGYGKTRQAEVDAMATAVEAAIADLAYAPADYSAVDAALAKVPESITGYTDKSAQALWEAVGSIERGLNVTEQARVDEMARALEAAIAGLEREVEPEPTTSETMWRLYNRWSGEHFYTANDRERAVLITVGWTDEGRAWTAPTEGAEVYRLFNPYADDHHYTMSVDEVDALVALGWVDEGLAWHSADKGDEGAVALYRLFNPYELTATHHYTASAAERDALEAIGWQPEGVSWYGVSAEG